jgi:hypothetical protein
LYDDGHGEKETSDDEEEQDSGEDDYGLVHGAEIVEGGCRCWAAWGGEPRHLVGLGFEGSDNSFLEKEFAGDGVTMRRCLLVL